MVPFRKILPVAAAVGLAAYAAYEVVFKTDYAAADKSLVTALGLLGLQADPTVQSAEQAAVAYYKALSSSRGKNSSASN